VEGVNAAIWSGIEINVAIACASLPALKPLIAKLIPGLLSTVSTRDRSGMNNLSDHVGSHQMSNLQSRNKETNSEAIKVVQSVYQTREIRASLEGSEKSLVNWKSEIAFAEPKKQRPFETV